MFDVGPARCKRGGTMPCPGAFTARLGSELARKPLISSEKVIRLVVWLMVVAAIEAPAQVRGLRPVVASV